MTVAYIVRSWPRLSQTFILNEVLGLEALGVELRIFAMTRAAEPVVQPQVADVVAPVLYLDERRGAGAHVRALLRSPRRYVGTLVSAVRQRELYGGYTASGPLGAFHRAVFVAAGADGCTHVHAHFAHDPALIALLVRRLTGLPFSFTAHARDLYQIPPAALAARAAEASRVVTCCRANVEHVDGPVEVIYHGVDLETFRPPATGPRHDVPVIVSVGRLVEKKGFDTLMHACSRLVAAGEAFRCEIYGDGPDRADLETLRDRLRLAGVVELCGARTQPELVEAYHRADLFALTPRVTSDGDRDGVPNVLVEAMACGLPVVTTLVGGAGELVVSGDNGLLADPDDADGIAACLAKLLADEAERRRMGEAAARTAAGFDCRVAARRLAEIFGARA
ncbi:MAG: glycosyltransferase [Acidimicrobiales bacterium]